MMKRKIVKAKFVIIIGIAFIAVGLDLATSRKYAVEENTYRFESDFDAVSAATATVAIVPSDYAELSDPVSRTVNPTYAQIEGMVRKAIELQGGFEWVISPGDMVMLKVNLVGGDSPSGEGENTDVRVVKALIKIIDEHTGGNVEIVVAEGTARSNDGVDETNSVWDNSGYQDLITDTYLTGINFRLFNLNQTYDQLIEITLGNKGTGPHGGKYHIHREEIEADVYISVPVLKIHDTGLTNALKNQIGTAPGSFYGYNKMKGTQYHDGLIHDIDHRRWTTEEIVDLNAVREMDFVVVDAIMCLESYKTFGGDNQVRFNTIIASADLVAADHVSAKILNLNPDDIAHVTLAEKIGIGTNNSEDIEVVGSSISEVMKKVKQNSSPNGKFGQSNRTWLLSESFNSIDIDENLISDEETIQPKAGENGWSQPVFFFDDRLDLLSYYHGAEDVISYAFSYFYSPQEQDAELWLGAQEDIIVYINGTKVHSFSGVKSFGDNDLVTDKVDINIKKGLNTLVVKSLNQFGDYSFCLNICEVESNSNWEGNRVAGLKFLTDAKDSSIVVVEPEQIGVEKISLTGAEIWPNPAMEEANISLSLNAPSDAKIFISDLSGRQVKEIADHALSAGTHEFNWDLNDLRGKKVPNGVYICTFRINSKTTSVKLIVNH